MVTIQSVRLQAVSLTCVLLAQMLLQQVIGLHFRFDFLVVRFGSVLPTVGQEKVVLLP